MLTSSARQTLTGVETVIVDEIHAVAGTKRGSHLAVSLERLDALVGRDVQRVALSATVRPIERVAAFLGGDLDQMLNLLSGREQGDRDLAAGAEGEPIAWGDDRGELRVVACGRCATCDAEASWLAANCSMSECSESVSLVGMCTLTWATRSPRSPAYRMSTPRLR